MNAIFYLLCFLCVAIIGCNETLLQPNDNQLPETTIFLDTVRTQQNSRIFVSWSGDDPDGMVI